MQYEISFQPAFSVVRLLLDMGESIRAEAGAMVSMSPTITLDSKAQGGLGKAFGRLLGGESFFQTFFHATHGPGELVLAPAAIGDIMPIQLQGEGWMVTSGSYLAGSPHLEIETRANVKAFFAGEGLFIMRIAGTGQLFLSSFGAIRRIDLAHGESYIVDTGHIVAFSETMGYQVHAATKSLIGSFTSGEGYVATFSGPGTLFTQSRSPQSTGAWLSRFIPTRS
ncbi:MAG: TIGR00266 family protein [Fimbriimonadaceae bacterium]|nr:TIGR00266 family protein [Fimbriimonadaceae bacterium]